MHQSKDPSNVEIESSLNSAPDNNSNGSDIDFTKEYETYRNAHGADIIKIIDDVKHHNTHSSVKNTLTFDNIIVDPDPNDQFDAIAGALPHKRGRKRKDNKSHLKNLSKFIKLREEDSVQTLTLQELNSYIARANTRVTIENITTDIINPQCLEGWNFKQEKNVYVHYKIGCSLKKIKLNHLRDRGFSLTQEKRKTLSKTILDKIIKASGENIRVTKINTDDNECVSKIDEGSWTYYDSSNVHVFYIVKGDEGEYKIYLNHLLSRGFPILNPSVKFYSFLQFKVEIRKHYKQKRISFEDAVNDKNIFEDVLHRVNKYYKDHPQYVLNEGLEPYRGPKSFDERKDLTKMHYYGKGKTKYYRWSDLENLITNDYGQSVLSKFHLNPSGDTIAEETFEEYLSQINNNITKHVKKINLLTTYAGPQCYEDRTDLERLNYNIKYVQKRSDPVTPIHLPTNQSMVDLKETVFNCSFSLRKCDKCDQLRMLGKRAAEKYPLASYVYGDIVKRKQLSCDQLFLLNCAGPPDVTPLSSKDLVVNETYVAYTQLSEISLCGYIIEVRESNDHNNFRIQCKTFFGPKNSEFSDVSNFCHDWVNECHPERFKFGVVNKWGRFTCTFDAEFCIASLNVDLREAKCCQPFHDTNRHTKLLEYISIDPNDITEKLSFQSLIAVRNIHSVLENIKILYCVKCNRECPGFEDIDEILIKNNGKLELLTKDNDADLYNAIHMSEVIKLTNLKLSKMFKNTEVYNLKGGKHVSSICTLCEPYYQVDEDYSVNPIAEKNELQSHDSQDSQDSQGSQSRDENLQLNQINKWGPENLFTLNLLNDHAYESFMNSLTRAEFMCISPLLINITILRCRATQIPFSRHGSIAFPLKSPMQAKSLPWYDFKNLPFIIIYRDDPNEKYRFEAKINLTKIIKAKEWMEKRITYQGEERTLNRLVDKGFMLFTAENFKRLKDELNGNTDGVIPNSIREHQITEETERISEPINKELVRTWLKSNYVFAQAVLFGLNDEDCEEDRHFESFWKSLEEFSLKSLQSKISHLQDNNIKETHSYQDWIEAGTIVTPRTLTEYAENKKYLNRVDNLEEYDTTYSIFEEFVMVKQTFSNDLGLDQLAVGGTVHSAEEHPDVIVERSLKDTALDRRPVEPDRANPAVEWEDSYLQRAFVNVFLTGDAALDQQRTISLKDSKDESVYRERYIKMLAMQKGVQDKPEFLFTLYNLLKRQDARKAAKCVLRDVDITSIDIPTKEDLQNDITTKKSNLLMQYTPIIRDTAAWYKSLQHESVGVKRDFEYHDDESRPNENLIYPSHFRTMAPPYASVPFIHKLLTNDEAELKDAKKRKEYALIHPIEIEWIISLLAELDLLYFRKVRYNSEWYLARNEHGANGNPHWHSVVYSQELGKLCWQLKNDMTNLLNDLKDKHLAESTQITDKDISEMEDKIKERFQQGQAKIVEFFRGTYVNWNPCFTHDNKRTYESYGNHDISTISLSNIIDEALMSSDFTVIDKLYCDIIQTSCRHITHTGKHGLPSKKDYCYHETTRVDKEKSTKDTAAYKVKSACKRRKPQPVRRHAAIYRDPHDKKYFQLSFACNDGLFNGADPFLILNNLGNADTKAVIPSSFVKCPRIVQSGNDGSLMLQFYQNDTADPSEYILKYMTKAAIPLKTDADIMKNVLQRMVYNSETDNINNNAEINTHPNCDKFRSKYVFAMYNQAAVQNTVCLYNAQHVNMGLPQVFKNYKVYSYNCLGRRTIKKNSLGSSNATIDLYDANVIQHFDNRMNITDKSRRDLGEAEFNKISGPMTLRTFVDKYAITWDKTKQLVLKKRRRTDYSHNYHAIRIVPHTTMGEARPGSKYFHNFCKKMCLCSGKYSNISDTVKTDMQRLGISDNKEKQEQYWVDEFYKRFPPPNFDGLEPAYKSYAMHYHNPDIFDSDSEEDDLDTTTIRYETKNKDNKKEKIEPNAKVVSDKYYQHPTDKLYKHGEDIGIVEHFPEDPSIATIEKMTTDFVQLPTVEQDCRQWAGNYINLDDRKLVSRIEATYSKMLETKGKSEKEIPVNPELTVKQRLVKDILTDYVTQKSSGMPVDPLRLFVIGIPGAGKTFAFQVSAAEIIHTLGDEWRQYVRLACPTGSVAYHMGFGAQTIHSTFVIEVSKVGKSIEDQMDKMVRLVKQNPKTVFLIIFDECSMIAVDIFGAVCMRLREAKIEIEGIAFVFFGDPAQCEPVGGYSLWTTQINMKRSGWKISLDGINDFRNIMGMIPLEDLPYQKEILKLRAKKSMSQKEIEKLKLYEQEFGKVTYKGSYRAIYMDEVKRTDGSLESAEFVKLNTKVRYGKYEHKDLAKLRKMTATKEKAESSEWKYSTLLTAYHFHSEENPNRTNADTSNAKDLVVHAEKSKKTIMVFHAAHTPEAQASQLELLSPKLFHNLPNKLYLISGAPVILSCNINATVSLYNGAKGSFIGPLYSLKKYSISSYDMFTDSAINKTTLKTTKQIQVKLNSGSSKVLPAGTPLIEINGEDCSRQGLNDLNADTFQNATFLLPRRPPFLPDYLIIEVEGYSESGGPAFFPGIDHMKDYVCIKPFQRDKESIKSKHVPKARIQFPVELAYVMTAFKGIGATHKRTVAKLKGMFHKGGLFYVSHTRVKNPEHLYIPDEHWPTVDELSKIRCQLSVLQSENFERLVRAKSAQEMRKSKYHEALPNFPMHRDKNTFNHIADILHDLWLEKGKIAKHDKSIQDEIKEKVLQKCNSLQLTDKEMEDLYHEVVSFMRRTDEAGLLKKVPCLPYNNVEVNRNTDNSKSNKKRSAETPSFPEKIQQKRVKLPKTVQQLRAFSAQDENKLFSNNGQMVDTNNNITPCPLVNTGNTCFINASLQLLLSLNSDRTNTLPQENALITVNDENDPLRQCALAFSVIADHVNTPLASRFVPSQFNQSVYNLVSDIQVGQQEDVTRVLRPLILNPNIFNDSEFKLHIETSITCEFCKNISRKTEIKTLLVVSVPETPGDIQCLVGNEFSEEVLTGENKYHCDRCGLKREARRKSVLIQPLPRVLLINLGRFQTQSEAKNTNKVSLGEGNIFINYGKDSDEETREHYKLQSAISHVNSDWINAGHYIAHVKKNDKWYKCDDEIIEECTRRDIPEEGSYILAFEKD